MTFKDYVLSRRDGDNPRGDFIRDVRRDESFPDCTDQQKIREYLKQKQANEAAIRELEKLYKEYRREPKE